MFNTPKLIDAFDSAVRAYTQCVLEAFWAQSVTVHPFFRPDIFLPAAGRYGMRASGEDRTKHCTTLGAAVGEMVEALG